MTEDSASQTTSGHDVFVSYASYDAVIAQKVCSELEAAGFKCWIAPRDVVPGTLYADGIVGAIDESKILVLILSKNAVASAHVGKELERATSKRHPIIALRLDTAPLTRAFEYFLNESQWIDVGAGNTDAAIEKLVVAVGQHLPPWTVTSPTSANQASVLHRKTATPRRTWIIAAVIVVSLAGAYFLVDKAWHSRQETTVGTAVISDKSIAVLPFVDMSEKKDQEYFSDGMSEELIDMLTKIPDLQVTARTSAFSFKGRPTTITDIARTLGVAYVLEGSVRKSGETVRVTAQLIRVRGGYHVWSETYDRPLNDVFKVQDDVAGAVVKALKVSLLGGDMPRGAGTRNAEAYNLYLQGKAAHGDRRSENETAVLFLRKAILADPNYADAWALLSLTLSLIAEDGSSSAVQLLAEARRAALQALTLDPQLAAAHAKFAGILIWDDLDIRGGETQIEQARKLDPNDSYTLSIAGTVAAYRGDFNKAIELVRQSISSDPINPIRYRDLAWVLFYATKYSDALTAYQKMVALKPDARANHTFSAKILLAQNDPVAALAEIAREETADREICECVAIAYDMLGRKAEADAELASLIRKHAADSAYAIALIYANRGEIDHAFEWFDRAYEQRDLALLDIKVHPLVRNVQTDPRFAALLRKLNLQ
jgi:TolB-like protein/Tfp pilus assembly protein PilF